MAKKEFVQCETCGASLRPDNLRSHVRRVHGLTGKRTSGGGGGSKRAPSRGARSKSADEKSRFGLLAVTWIIVMSMVAAGAYIAFAPTGPGNGGGGGGGGGGGPTIATVVTTMGTFKMEMYTEQAPVTAGNFITLAKSGFYNGLTFHRVIEGFVIQGGDPNGDGSGGSENEIPWEDTGLNNRKYTVAMARSNPNDASSQFFVNLADNTNLDAPSQQYPYVVFAKVIEGTSVVDNIARVPTDGGDKPLTAVTMISVTISE